MAAVAVAVAVAAANFFGDIAPTSDAAHTAPSSLFFSFGAWSTDFTSCDCQSSSQAICQHPDANNPQQRAPDHHDFLQLFIFALELL